MSERLWTEVGKRDGWTCHYCGDDLIPPALQPVIGRPVIGGYVQPPGYRFPQLDHVVPRSQGGKDGAANRVLACASCNQSKKVVSRAEFLWARTA